MRRGKPTAIWVLVTLLGTAATATAGEWAVQLGEEREVASKILGRKMTLVVHLPDAYEKSDERYAVVYMIGSGFRARYALLASALDYMGATGQIPSMILVGIDLPEGNSVLIPREGDGGTESADKHLEFLRQEVIPLVDGAYRTAPYRLLYGASNSGLFAVYALLSHPDPFNAYLASSPMLGWSLELIAKKAKAALAVRERPGRFLYTIYSDDDYGRTTDAVPPFLELLEEMRPAWLEWQVEVRANEGHVPVVDVPMGLKAVFPDYNPTSELATLEQLTGHFEGLSKRYGFAIPTPASMIFGVGMDYVGERDFDRAIKVFEYAIATYPQRSRGYIGLGIVHRLRGDTEKAREWLLKALEVDPDDRVAQRQLARLDDSS